MKIIAASCLAFLAALSLPAAADDKLTCETSAGSYLSGTVVKAPVFVHGQYRKGIELSHTHLSLRADQDGRTYDVAIDNVFANGYDPQARGVPPVLAKIHVDDRLALCGQLYARGIGIHWVHGNCGARPTSSHPDGWIKPLSAAGSSGINLEGNTSYCPLFGRRH